MNTELLNQLIFPATLLIVTIVAIICFLFCKPPKAIDIRQTDTLKRIRNAVSDSCYRPTIDRTTKPPTPNSSDPLHILREDCYTNDDINRMTGEMHRRQYAESQQ
jgi:hypothetical protein